MPQEVVIGTKALAKKLRELEPKKQAQAIGNAVNAAMLPVMRQAKTSVPIGTVPHKTYKGRLVAPGFLSRSIKRVKRRSRDRTRFYSFVGVAPEAFYGLQFLELGTSRIARRPWLEPAYRARRREVEALLTRKLREQIIKKAKQK